MADNVKQPKGYRRHRDRAFTEKVADQWNQSHAVGSQVLLSRDNGEIVSTWTSSEAFLTDNGEPVIFLESVGGYYALHRVSDVPPPMIDAVPRP